MSQERNSAVFTKESSTGSTDLQQQVLQSIPDDDCQNERATFCQNDSNGPGPVQITAEQDVVRQQNERNKLSNTQSDEQLILQHQDEFSATCHENLAEQQFSSQSSQVQNSVARKDTRGKTDSMDFQRWRLQNTGNSHVQTFVDNNFQMSSNTPSEQPHGINCSTPYQIVRTTNPTPGPKWHMIINISLPRYMASASRANINFDNRMQCPLFQINVNQDLNKNQTSISISSQANILQTLPVLLPSSQMSINPVRTVVQPTETAKVQNGKKSANANYSSRNMVAGTSVDSNNSFNGSISNTGPSWYTSATPVNASIVKAVNTPPQWTTQFFSGTGNVSNQSANGTFVPAVNNTLESQKNVFPPQLRVPPVVQPPRSFQKRKPYSTPTLQTSTGAANTSQRVNNNAETLTPSSTILKPPQDPNLLKRAPWTRAKEAFTTTAEQNRQTNPTGNVPNQSANGTFLPAVNNALESQKNVSPPQLRVAPVVQPPTSFQKRKPYSTPTLQTSTGAANTSQRINNNAKTLASSSTILKPQAPNLLKRAPWTGARKLFTTAAEQNRQTNPTGLYTVTPVPAELPTAVSNSTFILKSPRSNLESVTKPLPKSRPANTNNPSSSKVPQSVSSYTNDAREQTTNKQQFSNTSQVALDYTTGIRNVQRTQLIAQRNDLGGNVQVAQNNDQHVTANGENLVAQNPITDTAGEATFAHNSDGSAQLGTNEDPIHIIHNDQVLHTVFPENFDSSSDSETSVIRRPAKRGRSKKNSF